MPLGPEALESVKGELAYFASGLNLSDAQKAHMKAALQSARERFETHRLAQSAGSAAQPGIAWKQMRAALRAQLAEFLSPEQLAQWESKLAKDRPSPGILP